MTVIEIPEPTSNYASYRECLKEAAAQEPEAWTFKSDPRYQVVLEHVTQEQGEQFIRQVQTEYPDLWPAVFERLPDIVAENDRYGAPSAAPCSLGFTCSPTNLRYVSQALRLWTHAYEVGMTRMHVVEIGGGYGGLALYVHRLASLFPTVNLDWYTIVDLPEAVAVQDVMLGALGVPAMTVDGLDEVALAWCLEESKAPKFLFSAYAFSEFDADTRAWYEQRVARRCVHGVVIWNFRYGVHGFGKVLGGPVYQFVDAPLRVEPDRPEMYAEGVQLVRF